MFAFQDIETSERLLSQGIVRIGDERYAVHPCIDIENCRWLYCSQRALLAHLKKCREGDEALEIRRQVQGRAARRWTATSWFKAQRFQLTQIVMEPAAELAFYDSCGRHYVNLFEGRLPAAAFSEFPAEARDAVHAQLAYWKAAICGGDVDNFNYLVLWLAAVEAGQKTGKILFIENDYVFSRAAFKVMRHSARWLEFGQWHWSSSIDVTKSLSIFYEPTISASKNAEFCNRLRQLNGNADPILVKEVSMSYYINNWLNFLVATKNELQDEFRWLDFGENAEDVFKIVGEPQPPAEENAALEQQIADGMVAALIAWLREMRAGNPFWQP